VVPGARKTSDDGSRPFKGGRIDQLSVFEDGDGFLHAAGLQHNILSGVDAHGELNAGLQVAFEALGLDRQLIMAGRQRCDEVNSVSVGSNRLREAGIRVCYRDCSSGHYRARVIGYLAGEAGTGALAES
jgi:hypothetical protein